MLFRSNDTATTEIYTLSLHDALPIYGNNSPAFDRSIDVCVGRLRKKLQDDPRNPAIIRTVRNGGYIFSAKVARH